MSIIVFMIHLLLQEWANQFAESVYTCLAPYCSNGLGTPFLIIHDGTQEILITLTPTP